MMIYCDVDGTLTEKQTGRSAFKVGARNDVIDKLKKLISEGHEVVIFTGNTEYAKKVAKLYGIDCVAAIRKPQLIIDNQTDRTKRRLKKCVVSPEDFLTMDFQL